MRKIILIASLFILTSCHEEKSNNKVIVEHKDTIKAIPHKRINIDLRWTSCWTEIFGQPSNYAVTDERGILYYMDKFSFKIHGDSILTNDKKEILKGKILLATHDTLILHLADNKKIDTLFCWKTYPH